MTESYREILEELRDDAARLMKEGFYPKPSVEYELLEMVEGLAQALLIVDERLTALENGTVLTQLVLSDG